MQQKKNDIAVRRYIPSSARMKRQRIISVRHLSITNAILNARRTQDNMLLFDFDSAKSWEYKEKVKAKK